MRLGIGGGSCIFGHRVMDEFVLRFQRLHFYELFWWRGYFDR
jgi:hypothetical protein